MVRTKGLDQALDRIIGRAIGRKDNRDSNEALQRRRPIAFTRRQREVVPVAEDVHHVDDAADEEHPKLKLSSYGRKVQKFRRPAAKIEGLIVSTGLSPLIACSLDTGNRGLILTFAERWHKETSSFHLPVGEETITLDDVASLLHLPITGAFYSFETLHVEEVVLLLVELLEVSADEARVETVQCHGTYVQLSWLRDIYRSKCDVTHWTIAARAYLS
ncbi:Protein MAIN-LIKE 1 [Glycine max]|nr:Protein MAIN-LIKE 1 [Glycine max]